MFEARRIVLSIMLAPRLDLRGHRPGDPPPVAWTEIMQERPPSCYEGRTNAYLPCRADYKLKTHREIGLTKGRMRF